MLQFQEYNLCKSKTIGYTLKDFICNLFGNKNFEWYHFYGCRALVSVSMDSSARVTAVHDKMSDGIGMSRYMTLKYILFLYVDWNL